MLATGRCGKEQKRQPPFLICTVSLSNPAVQIQIVWLLIVVLVLIVVTFIQFVVNVVVMLEMSVEKLMI